MYKIYFIINNVNKYLYIGSTNDFEKRKEQHIYAICGVLPVKITKF